MAEDATFLKIAVRKGLIDESEAKSYLRAFQVIRGQSAKRRDIADWLIHRGVLTEEACKLIRQQLSGSSKQPVVVFSMDSASRVRPREFAPPPPALDELDLTPVVDSGLAGSLKLSPLDSGFGGKFKSFGEYKIKHEIARGGMGAVYKVSHKEFGDNLALKVLLSKGQSNERQKRRFLREVETIQRIEHPGIVSIIDAGNVDGVDYLTMEFIDGRPFDELLKAKKLKLRDCLKIIRDMAIALDYAHKEGVIHRDLKPANVLIRKKGKKPVITDFGLAKDLLDSTVLSRTGTVIGTPRYLSPEQVMAEHEKIGPTTDIYALGVVLYECLTGIRPFDADSVESLYQKIEDEPPVHPCEVDPEVPKDLANIALKAMHKKQKRRYQRGKEMARDLEIYLKTGSVKVRRGKDSASTRFQEMVSGAKSEAKQNTLVWVLAAIFVALFLFIAVFFTVRSQSTSGGFDHTTLPDKLDKDN